MRARWSESAETRDFLTFKTACPRDIKTVETNVALAINVEAAVLEGEE
jgi:hypothetical protein